MKRKILIPLLLTQFAIGVHAQTKMILHQKMGGDIEILFADKPVATFEGDNMVITTAKASFSFPIINLGETTYSDATAAIIESVTQLSLDAGPSHIYDINGRLIKTVPVGEPINFGMLPQGIYVIKNNKSTYKINRKQ